ncbi:hypothetical protein Dimus_002898, partial [Dionaea muscipula]
NQQMLHSLTVRNAHRRKQRKLHSPTARIAHRRKPTTSSIADFVFASPPIVRLRNLQLLAPKHKYLPLPLLPCCSVNRRLRFKKEDVREVPEKMNSDFWRERET